MNILRYNTLFSIIKLQTHWIDQSTNNQLKKKVHATLSFASNIKFKYKYEIQAISQ